MENNVEENVGMSDKELKKQKGDIYNNIKK
jgi:hypothetical protein